MANTGASFDISLLSQYLPPYRSLLSPNTKYDYKTHQLLHVEKEGNSVQVLNLKNEQTTKEKLRMRYRSLLTPISDTRKKILNVASEISIRTPHGHLTFANFPDEVLSLVFHLLGQDQRTLLSLMYVSQRVKDVATPYLYRYPQLSSTYRVGQLVHTFNTNPSLACYVQVLDFSSLKPGLVLDNNDDGAYYINLPEVLADAGRRNNSRLSDNDLESIIANNLFEYGISEETPTLAGWRDWKFRHHALYGSNHRHFDTPKLRPEEPRKSRMRSQSESSLPSSRRRSLSGSNLMKESYELVRFASSFSTFTTKSSKRRNIFGLRKLLAHKNPSSDAKPKKKPNAKANFTFKPGSDSKNKYLARSENQPFATPHPVQNRFLQNYCFSKDVPIGYILHFLDYCKNVEILDLSGVSLSEDHVITNYETFDWNSGRGTRKLNYHPKSMLVDESPQMKTQQTVNGAIYLSDTAHRLLDTNAEQLKSVSTLDIVEGIKRLKHLQGTRLCSLIWLKKEQVFDIVLSQDAHSLEWLDASNSGMLKGASWASSRSLKRWKGFMRWEADHEKDEMARVTRLMDGLGRNF